MAVGVFVVDDEELLRLGVAALLEVESDLELVGEAARATDALARIQATQPDVVLLNTHLPDSGSVTLCREIRDQPHPAACLMLAPSIDDPALLDAIRAGAAGYVLKSVHSTELVDAVRKIAAGAPMLDVDGSDVLLERMRSEAAKADPLKNLNATDRQIVHLIGGGLTNRQIGESLGLSERTIKNHVSHVLDVLEMQRRTQIAVLAASLKSAGEH